MAPSSAAKSLRRSARGNRGRPGRAPGRGRRATGLRRDARPVADTTLVQDGRRGASLVLLLVPPLLLVGMLRRLPGGTGVRSI